MIRMYGYTSDGLGAFVGNISLSEVIPIANSTTNVTSNATSNSTLNITQNTTSNATPVTTPNTTANISVIPAVYNSSN